MRNHFRVSKRNLVILVSLLILGLGIGVWAQSITFYKGSSLHRAKNVMSGNLVRTTYYNYGLVGNIGEISGEWPIGTGNEYVGDVSPLVGVEFVHPSGDTLHSVATSDGPRGNSDGPPGGGSFWGFEPLPGFHAPPTTGQDPKVAMSNQDSTWPDIWPDKMVYDSLDRNWRLDAFDPGWPGSWNGFFGKNVTNADQESYFQMDDHSDGEWFTRILEDNPDAVLHWEPEDPGPGESMRIIYDATIRDSNVILPTAFQANLLWGIWGKDQKPPAGPSVPPSSSWPEGTIAQGRYAVSPMTVNGDGTFEITIQPPDTTRVVYFAVQSADSFDYNGNKLWKNLLPGTDTTFHYFPDINDNQRRGLGLRVKVRGLQWAHFLAQDVIFWLYEITNISSFVYDRVTFGMMVGTLSGGRTDSNDDLAEFDLENDITYSWDSDDVGSIGWVPVSDNRNVGYVGYAFLESPGNPLDGIDNDGDSRDPGSPVMTGALLVPRSYDVGDRLVLIDYNTYERTVISFPDAPGDRDSLIYFIRNQQFILYDSMVVSEVPGNGLDDNFNGLIDESLIHVSQPLRYKNYLTGQGLNDLLIDEARDDGIDNDGDWNPLTDDVGADGVAGSFDLGEADGIPTDGEPHFDKTDVDESDQIGLTSFDYFSPPGNLRMRDDRALWARMTPGHFDVAPDSAQDGDFVYGSGYFPLRPGQTERFSMALLYGEDFNDILDNKITVQQIYDENYNFARPPEKPTVWAVPGDGQVTLYWDGRDSESSLDPVCRCYDFEGYKIYRSTDPSFNEVFTITDGLGRRVFHRPIAQFDLRDNFAYVDSTYFTHVDSVVCDSFIVSEDPDTVWQDIWCYHDTLVHDSSAVGVEGFFPIIRNSVIYYLGDNTGLQHSWIDNTVENGQTYYYAVVAYDRGDIGREILPAENSKTIVIDEAGNITLDVNTVHVVPRAPASGYQPPEISTLEHTSGFSTGSVAIELVDPRLVQDGILYEFTFAEPDDSLAQDEINYVVLRHTSVTETLITATPLRPEAGLLPQADRFRALYDSLFNLPPGSYDPAQFFRVAGTEIFDGQRAYMLIPRQIRIIEEHSGWADTSRGLYEFRFGVTNYSTVFLTGEERPGDYQIEWFGTVADTSNDFNWFDLFVLPAVPVDFKIKNLNRNEYISFAFDESDEGEPGVVDNGDVIIFMEEDTVVTWAVEFRSRAVTGDTIQPVGGDLLNLFLYQPYSDLDRYEYDTRAARIDAANVKLDRIKVYPNPYLAASNQESPTLFNEGRGDRRITFNHLPDRCTIRIYTIKGDLVNTIEHNSTIDDGTENWNLRTKDGLNIAYGTYLFHVDSPYGEKIGRFAIIK